MASELDKIVEVSPAAKEFMEDLIHLHHTLPMTFVDKWVKRIAGAEGFLSGMGMDLRKFSVEVPASPSSIKGEEKP